MVRWGALYKFNTNMSYQGVKALHTIFRGVFQVQQNFHLILCQPNDPFFNWEINQQIYFLFFVIFGHFCTVFVQFSAIFVRFSAFFGKTKANIKYWAALRCSQWPNQSRYQFLCRSEKPSQRKMNTNTDTKCLSGLAKADILSTEQEHNM